MTAEPPLWSAVLAQEDLELAADWARLSAWWTDRFGREPTIESALFVVGLQELGETPRTVERDAKQAIIMEGTARVLGLVGVMHQSGENGPWERTGGLPVLSPSDQEKLLRAGLVRYFESVLPDSA